MPKTGAIPADAFRVFPLIELAVSFGPAPARSRGSSFVTARRSPASGTLRCVFTGGWESSPSEGPRHQPCPTPYGPSEARVAWRTREGKAAKTAMFETSPASSVTTEVSSRGAMLWQRHLCNVLPSTAASPASLRPYLISQNYRMFRVGRDLCGSYSPTPLAGSPTAGCTGPCPGRS